MYRTMDSNKNEKRTSAEKSNQKIMGESRSITIDVRHSGKDSNDIDSSLPAVKTIHEFEERLDKLQWLYFTEGHRFKRQMEMSQN